MPLKGLWSPLMMRNQSSSKHAQKRGRLIGAKDKNQRKRKAASLRESLAEKPLKEDDFSQKAIAKDETRIEITEPLDPLDMAPGVDVINENYEISINFVNT